jgi:phosphatidylglycerophosphate synthase
VPLIKDLFSTVPNWISLIRLVMVPLLWVWAIQGKYPWVGYGLIFTLVTDVLDGFCARLLDQCTEIGEKLDSFADHILLLSMLLWLVLYRTEVITHGGWLLIPAAGLYTLTMVIGLIKTRRFGGAHLLEGKPLAFFGFLFVVQTMFDIFSVPIYYGLIASWTIHSFVNLLYLYRPDLYNEGQRSLILGLMGIEIKEGLIKYLF